MENNKEFEENEIKRYLTMVSKRGYDNTLIGLEKGVRAGIAIAHEKQRKYREERDLLIEALKIFIDNTGYLDIWCNDSGWDKINKAKELLNTIKK